jgi:teichuronic acid biosynthesis glycosyltransferase TuaH
VRALGQSEHEGGQQRLVLITSDGPEHRYVANRIAEVFAVSAIIVDRGKPQTRRERSRSLRKKYTLTQLISRTSLRLTSLLFRDTQRRERDLLRTLGRTSREFATPDIVRYVDGINTPSGRAAVAEEAPDHLLVYGTGIVGSNVLDIARFGAINLHTGMSPMYRGSDCAFWPLFNREYNLVGATIHECTARIDGGEIYDRSPAVLHPDDGQFDAFARCVQVGADMYTSTIQHALSGSLEGETQDPDIGREYRAVDKHLWQDLSVRFAFLSGSFRRQVDRQGRANSLVGPQDGVLQTDATAETAKAQGDPPRNPYVSVTIVNHRSRELLRACLLSIRRNPYTLADMEIVVLDNASDDGSVEMLRDEFPEVTVLAERKRRGYGANQNLAVAASHGDVVFMLNPDAVIHKSTIDKLVASLSWEEDVAIAGGPITNDDGSLRQDRPHPFPTPWSPYAKAFGLLRLRGTTESRERIVMNGWPSGAAYLIERNAFDEVGGFDEGFFMYSEDTDLFARLLARGHLLAWVNDAIVTHPYRDESAELRARRQVEILNAEFQYMRKHYRSATVFRTGVVIDAAVRVTALSLPGASRLVRQHGKSRAYNLEVQKGRLSAALFVGTKPRLADLAEDWNRRNAPDEDTGELPTIKVPVSNGSPQRSMQNLIVFDSSTNWDGPWMAFQHIALGLTRYAPVLFVDAPQSPVHTYRTQGRLRVRSRLVKLDTNLYRLTPAAPPGLTRMGIHHLTGIAVRRALASAISDLDADVHAFLCSLSHTNLFDVADAETRVYYVSDDFQAGAALMGRPPDRIAALDDELAAGADAIVAISEPIADSLRERGYEPLLVPNGVDVKTFRNVDDAPIPHDVDLQGPIAGYIGHISDRIEMGLLEALAATGMSILLVGPRQGTFTGEDAFDELLAMANVQWVGPKPFDELPSYLRMMDVGLVPYANSEFNRASFPLKTLEYLAAGRPVVATPLPAIRWLDTPLISTADSPEDFARITVAAVPTSREPDRMEERRAFAATHSWDERVRQLAAILKLDPQ